MVQAFDGNDLVVAERQILQVHQHLQPRDLPDLVEAQVQPLQLRQRADVDHVLFIKFMMVVCVC